MPPVHDGPASRNFSAAPFKGNAKLEALAKMGASDKMAAAHPHAPSGGCTSWGIPFKIQSPLFLKHEPQTIKLAPFKSSWVVFMHCTDVEPLQWNDDGFITNSRGIGRLGERVADYVLIYDDGTEARHEVRRRHQIGMYNRPMWGENNFECVVHRKTNPIRPVHEQHSEPLFGSRFQYWGWSQTRVHQPDVMAWVNHIWAWENPHPKKRIVGVRFEPRGWGMLVSAIAHGEASAHPLRWTTRKKAVLTLPKVEKFKPDVDAMGLWTQIQLDLGQVISAQPRTVYPNESWSKTYDNRVPEISEREVLVEYASHPDAEFVIGGKRVPVSTLEKGKSSGPLTPLPAATQRVALKVIEKDSKKPVPVKFHAHGVGGEYLAPLDRHRIPNDSWFEDYSTDFVNAFKHACTYIPGETVIDLPLGKVFIEISKGFEIRPIRKVFDIKASTKTLTIPVEKVLPWRERGWVTADTHVHFISPATAQLQGAAEGVNVINLLTSQWGELMTNVGDFDGKTTFGSKEAGGDGEWLVRVGTENRQHILGHISLLGYEGNPILPLCVGGADEAAIGDPVGVLMAEWAQQCKKQGGLVVMPHFPNPRCENAANLISGDVDAVEMTSWGNLYGGIDPYSLSDWYRYLNCGYFLPAVGGTDKMSATTPVGAVRTYARIPKNKEFTYGSWMKAVRGGDTFVTYGPLLEFAIEGKPAGTRLKMKRSGGTVSVEWNVATCTVPLSHVDLVVNGEIRESKSVSAKEARGEWKLKTDKSVWAALLVRGHYPDKPEIVAAHSSPVMIEVEGSPFFAAADAVTILEQIEGALAYLDTIGTRTNAKDFKRMRLILTSAHRKLHNELHQHGHDHKHTHTHHHSEHEH
jgi:hypothetical protein